MEKEMTAVQLAQFINECRLHTNCEHDNICGPFENGSISLEFFDRIGACSVVVIIPQKGEIEIDFRVRDRTLPSMHFLSEEMQDDIRTLIQGSYDAIMKDN